MKTLYLDIFSGISGDMFIGALLDLGVEFGAFQQEIAKLKVGGFHLHAARKEKCGIQGVKFDVHVEEPHDHEHGHDHDHEHGHTHGHGHGHSHGHSDPLARLLAPIQQTPEHGATHGRNLSEIKELISGSGLSEWVKHKSLAIFSRVARAEGGIHGKPPESVHFHEVGAIDSIVDIIGAAIALEMLGKPRVLAGPVVEGKGFVRCAHGRFPLPAPATLAILGEAGVAITQCDEPQELVTPTGAAILAECVESFGGLSGLVPSRIGYGLGTRDNQTRPNVLRAILGEAGESAPKLDWEQDQIMVLETNLDDVPSEILGHFMEVALKSGALDVFYVPIHMKKNRPGVLLTLLCAMDRADEFTELILRETTAFGVRRTVGDRRKLPRKAITVQTEHGPVVVKLGSLNGRIIQASPEFESCKEAAARAGVPVREVYQAALQLVHKQP